MDSRSIIGESTNAILVDDSPTEEKEIKQTGQRWVVFVWMQILHKFTLVFNYLGQSQHESECFIHLSEESINQQPSVGHEQSNHVH